MAQFKLFTKTDGSAELMRKTICDKFTRGYGRNYKKIQFEKMNAARF
jgi:hypothetical protein